MNADMLITTLGEELFEAARPYWHNRDPANLHAAIAAFLLAVLKEANHATVAENTTLLAEVEREHILSMLKKCGGDQSKAARVLGIDRNKLYRKLDKYGLKIVRRIGKC